MANLALLFSLPDLPASQGGLTSRCILQCICDGPERSGEKVGVTVVVLPQFSHHTHSAVSAEIAEIPIGAESPFRARSGIAVLDNAASWTVKNETRRVETRLWCGCREREGLLRTSSLAR
jgi:hypothetical protein